MTRRLAGVRAAMVIAPHPDDEAIGAGNLIRALRRSGARVTVVVVSDGAASHPGSVRWPTHRLVAERRRETRRAMDRLGLHANDIVFLGLPDGALARHRDRCRRAVLREIARRRRLDLLIGPAKDDDHPDHRVVAEIMASRARAVDAIAYRVWPARRGGGKHGLRHSAASTASARRSLIRCYRTQCGAIVDDPAGFSIARHELNAFAHPIERFVQA